MADAELQDNASKPKWDFFISYASEDRLPVVIPLANALEAKGFKVWYDIFELKAGKSLMRSIDEGLRESRFGIVVLSPDFFAKEWPMRELSGLYSRSVQKGNEPFIIPVWYRLSASDLVSFSPLLADLVGISWNEGVDNVVLRIMANSRLQMESPEQQYARVLGESFRILSNPDYLNGIQTILDHTTSTVLFSALKAIALKADLKSEPRVRAVEVLSEHGELEANLLNEILAQDNTSMMRKVIELFTRLDIVLTQEQIQILFANSCLPRSTSGLGRLICQCIKQGGSYTSEVFFAGASYPAWQVKLDCVRHIIKLDDKDTLRTLAAYAPMEYWLVRRAIIEYIQGRAEGKRLTQEDQQIAEAILTQIMTDGRTKPETSTMHMAQEALALLQNKTSDVLSMERIKIVFFVADPTDMARLRLNEEIREIQAQLRLSKLRERFEFQEVLSVRPLDLSQALLDTKPQVVHFSGHGTADGALCVEDSEGLRLPIRPEVLSELFEQFADHIKCVVINACYSEVQAHAIAKHINYVIGMNQAIGDKAAIVFATGFYQALGAECSIEEAYRMGCIQLRLQGIPQDFIPVLIKKDKEPM